MRASKFDIAMEIDTDKGWTFEQMEKIDRKKLLRKQKMDYATSTETC